MRTFDAVVGDECRIQGELKKLGHAVARSTIAKALQDAGVPPSPERPTSWRTCLKAHAGTIAAMDFFTAEVWTARGLVNPLPPVRDPPRQPPGRDRRRHR